MKVGLAKWRGQTKGCVAFISSNDGLERVDVILHKTKEDGRTISLKAAQRLRTFANIFERLAKEGDPFKAHSQAMINKIPKRTLAQKLPFDLAKFSEINRKRSEDPTGFNHKLSSWSESDWLLAIVGEVGEAANIVKKLNRIRDGVRGNSEHETEEYLQEKLMGELADAFIYLDLFCQVLGVSLAEVVPRIFNAKSAKLGCDILYE